MSNSRKWDEHTQAQADAKGRQLLAIRCKQCGSMFYRAPSIKGRKPKFCTATCALENFRGMTHSKTFKKECVQCGKGFFVNIYKRKVAKFCSRECCWRFHGKRGGVQVPCDVCGKVLRRNPSNVNKKNYCGYECMAKGKILAAPRTNKWANVRKWFGRFGRMSKCERCGYCEEPSILVLHHKDRDRGNNQLGNLEVLCPNCHAKEHLAEHQRNWEGHVSSDPVKIARRKATQEKRQSRQEQLDAS